MSSSSNLKDIPDDKRKDKGENANKSGSSTSTPQVKSVMNAHVDNSKAPAAPTKSVMNAHVDKSKAPAPQVKSVMNAHVDKSKTPAAPVKSVMNTHVDKSKAPDAQVKSVMSQHVDKTKNPPQLAKSVMNQNVDKTKIAPPQEVKSVMKPVDQKKPSGPAPPQEVKSVIKPVDQIKPPTPAPKQAKSVMKPADQKKPIPQQARSVAKLVDQNIPAPQLVQSVIKPTDQKPAPQVVKTFDKPTFQQKPAPQVAKTFTKPQQKPTPQAVKPFVKPIMQQKPVPQLMKSAIKHVDQKKVIQQAKNFQKPNPSGFAGSRLQKATPTPAHAGFAGSRLKKVDTNQIVAQAPPAASTNFSKFPTVAPGSVFASDHDRKMAEKQRKIAQLQGKERKEQEEWAQKILSKANACVAGFPFIRDERIPGYQCADAWGPGPHVITDELLAEGAGGYYNAEFSLKNFDKVNWVGPLYSKEEEEAKLREKYASRMAGNIDTQSAGSRQPRPTGPSVFATQRDIEMANRQRRYNELNEQEKRQQEDWAQQIIQKVGVCPAGFGWGRQDKVPGYVCHGTTHLVTDEQLAEGQGAFYIRKPGAWQVSGESVWLGPTYIDDIMQWPPLPEVVFDVRLRERVGGLWLLQQLQMQQMSDPYGRQFR